MPSRRCNEQRNMYLGSVAKRQGRADELIRRLADVAQANGNDELAIPRIERDANMLMETDPVGAHTVLGGIGALRGDDDGVRNHHRIALDLDRSWVTYCNYSVSLSLLEAHMEAFEAAKAALQAAPDRPEVLDRVIKLSLEAACFIEARDFCSRWNDLAPNQPHHASHSVMALAKAVEDDSFHEEGVRNVMIIVGSVQRAKQVGVRESRISHNPSEPHCFLYERRIHGSPVTAAEMNAEVADRIAERIDLMEDPGLRFLPMYVGEL